MIGSQRCQNDSAVVSCGHNKTLKRGNHADLTTPKLGSPSTYQTKPPQNDKLEFPAQAQTSEIYPKLKVFLRHRLGPSPRGSFGQCFPSCLCWCQAAVPGILHLPHPSSSPARCHAQLPALLALRCAKVHSNGLTQDPGTSPVGATREAPATDPLLPWKFAPAHLSWKDPHLAQQMSVPSCGSW